MDDARILLVPFARNGSGTGHLRRLLALHQEFAGRSCILAEFPESRGLIERLLARTNHASGGLQSLGSGEPRTGEPSPAGTNPPVPPIVSLEEARGTAWDLVVFDRKTTPLELFFVLARECCSIGIDEGGPARRYMSYLFDILPFDDRGHGANESGAGFLELPSAVKSRPVLTDPGTPGSISGSSNPAGKNAGRGEPHSGTNRRSAFGRVLVTFGGEDPAGLTEKTVRALVRHRLLEPGALTAVKGPLFRQLSVPEGVSVLESPRDLRERLAEFDLVITSFGITAYEAVAAGTPIVLINPGALHRRLSRRSGFPEAGTGAPNIRKLSRLLAAPERLEEARAAAVPSPKPPLADAVGRLELASRPCCPACGASGNRAAARFPGRSFFRCSDCGLLYELEFSRTGVSYDAEYFFSEYRAQYGKTYLEDFESIRAVGRVRASILKRTLTESLDRTAAEQDRPAVLDIGCAYGPFLSALADEGCEPYGTDISADAVAHVNTALGFPAAATAFPAFDPARAFGRTRFDAVTMWYVIEHFEALAEVLLAVNRLLPEDGVFAFSTPNARGISGRVSLGAFLGRSPRDHFTVWEPRTARAVLSLFGFKVRRIRVTGHHPERFPCAGKLAGTRGIGRAVSAVLRFVSRAAGLGDTFEVYALKTRSVCGVDRQEVSAPAGIRAAENCSQAAGFGTRTQGDTP